MIRTLILITFGLGLVVWALQSLRRQRLKERWVILMSLAALPFLVLAFWPDGILFVSNVLQIEKATVLVLALGSFLIVMIFKLLSIVSVQDQKLTTLTQLTGILLQEAATRPPAEQAPEGAASTAKDPSGD